MLLYQVFNPCQKIAFSKFLLDVVCLQYNPFISSSRFFTTCNSLQFDPEDDLPIIKQGKISFVDLAGIGFFIYRMP